MEPAFDPYHKRLGIPPEEQPANHYRLLGIRLFEIDADVIDSAADKCMAHLRSFQTGKNAQLAQKLLNEVSAARVCLLNEQQRANYDATLQSMINASMPPAIPTAHEEMMAVPLADPMPSFGSPQSPSMSNRVKRQPVWVLPATIGGTVVALLIVIFVVMSIGGENPNEVVGEFDENRNAKSNQNAGSINRSDGESNQPVVTSNVEPRVTSQKPLSSSSTDTKQQQLANTSPAPSDHSIDDSSLKSVDLLELVDFENSTAWQVDQGMIIPAKVDEGANLQIPYSPPAEYKISIKCKYHSGSGGLALVLSGNGNRFAVMIDGWGSQGGATGIHRLDATGALSNATTTRGFHLRTGKEVDINYTLRKESLVVEIDGKKVIDWQGDFSRCSIREADRPYYPTSQLGLRLNKTAYQISKLELTPLADKK